MMGIVQSAIRNPQSAIVPASPRRRVPASLLIGLLAFAVTAHAGDLNLTMSWKDKVLSIKGDFPGGEVTIWFMEAYCRAMSTDRDWLKFTTIGHTTKLVEASPDGKVLKLRCDVNDGTSVDHIVTAGADEIVFEHVAKNPTEKFSDNQWAQPCVRVPKFTGGDKLSYIPKCFIFLDGKMARLPTQPWAEKAFYVPGQVYCPKHVDRNDVNPRPLSTLVPSNGLMGVYSADEKKILALAWEPYQELFQGVGTCIHSDFRIGGLKPGETKKIRGKIYILEPDVDAMVKRYEKDFPEHVEKKK